MELMNERPPENSVLINVCVIPESKIGETCVELSQSLKSDSTLFVLDGENKYAHMTLFMARFALDKLDEVQTIVEKILKNTKSFMCDHSGYFMTSGGYLEVSYQKSDDLMNLHEAVIDGLQELRINPGNPHQENYFAPYAAEQKRNAQETGYDLARDLYRPHITLTRYKEGMIPESVPDFAPLKLSFEATQVCVYKADENGAVYELIKSFTIA
jgi:2'-5' RNA ligase